MLLSPRPAHLTNTLDNPTLPIPIVSPVKGKSKASSPQYDPQSESDDEEEVKPKISRSNSRSRSTSLPACRIERKFKCLHPGCDKAYFKPSRLAEHELCHTGERPHKCPNCGQSYLRASHLHAHMRTHLSPDAKPFRCEREGCDKIFWTATHLKRHHDVHDKAEVYACDQCDETFVKAHLLRDHVTVTHMPEGAKPYPCSHEGCAQSFKMKAHLKAHEKTHDPNRYTCSHPSHGDEFPSFPVWSALQTHIHTAHPPVCPHAECNGRVFKNAGRLKDHLKVHAEQAVDKAALAAKQPEGEIPQIIADGLSRRAKRRRISEINATEDGGSSPKLRRVLSGEAGKDWWCDEEGCDKRFKSKFALEAHRKAIHLSLRPHICPFDECGKSYPHKANLTRHIASHSRPITPSGTTNKDDAVANSNGLVGKVKEVRRFGCPAHAFAKFAGLSTTTGDIDIATGIDLSANKIGRDDEEYIPSMNDGRCLMRFWRVYDIRRHLKAEHGIELEDMETRRLLLFDGQTGE
ncbi:uncharacterized protein L199_004940 [Kwoniella botswanensis]|uniref:uncharacterized protein n=1 Tax=Kwoniella botswanensis TaxID=1268659 RepID=UPI00315E023B